MTHFSLYYSFLRFTHTMDHHRLWGKIRHNSIEIGEEEKKTLHSSAYSLYSIHKFIISELQKGKTREEMFVYDLIKYHSKALCRPCCCCCYFQIRSPVSSVECEHILNDTFLHVLDVTKGRKRERKRKQ